LWHVVFYPKLTLATSYLSLAFVNRTIGKFVFYFFVVSAFDLKALGMLYNSLH
jgi:hypothetical protein